MISLKSRDSQESSPAPQFESIKYSVLSLLYDPTLISIPDYCKNHSFDCMNLCLPSDVSVLFCFLIIYFCMFVCLNFWLCWIFVAACWPSLLVVSGGHPVVEVQGRLTVVASLVEQYRLQGAQAVVVMACGLRSWGSRLPELGLGSCGTWA